MLRFSLWYNTLLVKTSAAYLLSQLTTTIAIVTVLLLYEVAPTPWPQLLQFPCEFDLFLTKISTKDYTNEIVIWNDELLSQTLSAPNRGTHSNEDGIDYRKIKEKTATIILKSKTVNSVITVPGLVDELWIKFAVSVNYFCQYRPIIFQPWPLAVISVIINTLC